MDCKLMIIIYIIYYRILKTSSVPRLLKLTLIFTINWPIFKNHYSHK